MCTMDYSKLIVSHQKEESISLQRVNQNMLWVLKRNVSMRHPKHVRQIITLYLIETPFNTFANRADLDQTALVRAAWSWSTLFAYGNMIYLILH